MNVQEAGEAPRFRHSPAFGLAVEPGIDDAVQRELGRMGHPVITTPVHFGGYQAIQMTGKTGPWSAAPTPARTAAPSVTDGRLDDIRDSRAA